MARVTMPLLLQQFTGGERHAEVPGASLADIISALDRRYPGLGAWILPGGKLTPILKFTIDGKLAMEGLDSSVGPDSEVCLLPSMGGG
jgi:molybdopterin converting factor small subunit